MPTLYDLAYRALLVLGAPAMWVRPGLRAKLARAHRERNGEVPARRGDGPCVLIHAVSVGEVNATREMVARLLEADTEAGSAQARDGALVIVLSVTTDTGFERARHVFAAEALAGRVSVVRYPLDLSRYVERFLDRLRPAVAVLMELEVWPNFVLACRRRGVPVLLVNGRLTERSYRGYRRFRPLVRPVFSALSAVCAQEEAYATRFVDLGVAEARVSVTGTMKFDSAHTGERVEGDKGLAEALGLNPKALGGPDPLLVCGSTGPGEEEILLEVYSRLRLGHPNLKLLIVPRKPERFDEVAQLMGRRGHVTRRSATGTQAGRGLAHASAMVLGDTMGELRKFYSLADVVVVGRTLLDLGEKQHGSDMIEPAALAKAIVVGPFTGNFAEPMRALLAAHAIRQIAASAPEATILQLVAVIEAWLADPTAAADVGRRAREVVLANRGATQRHVQLILQNLRPTSAASPQGAD